MAACLNLRLADLPMGQVEPADFALSVAADRLNFILHLLLRGKDTSRLIRYRTAVTDFLLLAQRKKNSY